MKEHLKQLRDGVGAWNNWRRRNPAIEPILREVVLLNRRQLQGINLRKADISFGKLGSANLSKANCFGASFRKASLVNTECISTNFGDTDCGGADFSGAKLIGSVFVNADLRKVKFRKSNLRRCNFSSSNLEGAQLELANLKYAHLDGANLRGADLRGAVLSGATLRGTDLTGAQLHGCDLSNADLSNAVLVGVKAAECNLSRATLVGTSFDGANISGSTVFGVSAWGVSLVETRQEDLLITDAGEAAVTLDNLEVAQFVHLMIHNEKLRDVVDSITSRVVLILGRFTPERKAVLDAIRMQLRSSGYAPILFDFDAPQSRDITETVLLLAHLAKFIIADLSDPRSIPKELEAVIPRLAIPVLPLLEESQQAYAMFADYWKYDWVLSVLQYSDIQGLRNTLVEKGFAIAESKRIELNARRASARLF